MVRWANQQGPTLMAADLVADEKRDDKLITPRGQGLGPDGENIQGFPAYEKNKDSILFHRDYEENEAVSYNLYSLYLTVYFSNFSLQQSWTSMLLKSCVPMANSFTRIRCIIRKNFELQKTEPWETRCKLTVHSESKILVEALLKTCQALRSSNWKNMVPFNPLARPVEARLDCHVKAAFWASSMQIH